MALWEALVIGLIALIIAPGHLFYFDVTPKIAVLLAGTAVLLVAAVRNRNLSRGPRLFAVLLAANAGSLALSTLFSTDRALSLYGSTWRAFGALVQCAALLFAWLVARSCTARPDRARTILRGLSVAGLLSAAYGVSQYFGWDPLLPQASYRVGEGVWSIVRPPGTLGYSSYFATWLLMTVFLSLAQLNLETRRAWQVIAVAASSLALVAMVLTGTRAALLGVAAGGAAWLWWSGFRIPRRALVAALALAAIAIGFYFSPLGLQLRSRTRWFIEDPWGGARPLLWVDSFWMALNHPLVGFGPEVFLAQFPHYESKALAEAYPDFVHESPHNIFLDAMVAQGLPGFLILIALCGAGFSAAGKLRQQQSATAAWFAAALAAGIVSQQFTAFTMPTALLLLTTIALAAALAAEAGEPRRTLLFPSVAPILVVALLYLALRITAADHALERTSLLVETSDLRATTAEYESYWFWHLPGADADLWYSRMWMQIARRMLNPSVGSQAMLIAAQAAQRATRSAEEPFAAWYNLAQIASQREDYVTTDSSLRKAIDAHPNWFKPHWMLAQELSLMDRNREAEQQAALAVELDGGHHPEVAQTLRDIRALITGKISPN
jgi:O-antigen ligase